LSTPKRRFTLRPQQERDAVPDSHATTPDTRFAAAFQEVTRASHPAGALYSDPAILEREMTNIFLRDWLCLARAEELEKTGDFRTFRIGREPVLLVRDKAGKPRAYANMCLHRGVEIANGAGSQRAFMCPYHGWSYGLDGRLIGASYMDDAEGFDRANCRLREYQLREWHGWIFVSLAEQPEDFDAHMAVFEEKFGWVGMADMRVGLRIEVELKCNWKLMVENFIDFYHLKVLHKETIGRFFTNPDVDYDLHPGGQIFIDEYDAGTLSKTGEVFAKRIPSMEGKSPRFSRTGVLPPNMNGFLRPDYASFYTSWPLGVDRMKMVGFALWPREVMEGPDRDRIVTEFKGMLDKVLAEDFEMVESLQNVATSRTFVPGRMSRLERGVQHFIKHSISRVA
jgi:Rieske 2Fe-2S family protein